MWIRDEKKKSIIQNARGEKYVHLKGNDRVSGIQTFSFFVAVALCVLYVVYTHMWSYTHTRYYMRVMYAVPLPVHSTCRVRWIRGGSRTYSKIDLPYATLNVHDAHEIRDHCNPIIQNHRPSEVVNISIISRGFHYTIRDRFRRLLVPHRMPFR